MQPAATLRIVYQSIPVSDTVSYSVVNKKGLEYTSFSNTELTLKTRVSNSVSVFLSQIAVVTLTLTPPPPNRVENISKRSEVSFPLVCALTLRRLMSYIYM
jgi:hypothetical protein